MPEVILEKPRRRDATKLIFDILMIARSPVRKTHIVNRVNLNFKLIEKYLNLLKAKQFLQTEVATDGGTYYVLTTNGEQFLQFLRQVEEELIEMFPMRRSTLSIARQSLPSEPKVDTTRADGRPKIRLPAWSSQ